MSMKVIKDTPKPDRYCPKCEAFLTLSMRENKSSFTLVLSCPEHGPVKEYSLENMHCPECMSLLEISLSEKENTFSVTIVFSCPKHGAKERRQVDYEDFLYR